MSKLNIARAILGALLIACFLTAYTQGPPELRWLKGGTPYGVNSLAYSPDGRLFASGGDDMTVKVFSSATGRLVRSLVGHTNGSSAAVRFSPDGLTLASTGLDRMVRLWDVATGQQIRSWVIDPYVAYGLDFSPDGKNLVTGGTDGLVKVWDVATGTLVRQLSGHTDYVYDVEYSPDGKLLVSGSDDQTIRFWDPQTGQPVRTISNAHDWFVIDVDFTRDGTRIASTGGNDVPNAKIWRVSDGALLKTINADPFSIAVCEWSPDGTQLMTIGRYGIKVWNAATGTLLRQAQNGDMTMKLSPDGTQLVHTGTGQSGLVESETVYQRRFVDLSLIREVSAHTSWVTALDFNPVQDMLASGCGYFESSSKLWTYDSELIRTLLYTNVQDGILDIEFSDDGSLFLAGGSQGDAKLYDVATGEQLQRFKHGGIGPLDVYSVAFDKSNSRVFTGGSDGFIKVWDLASGSQIDQWKPDVDPYVLRVSPDGTMLAVGTGGGINLLDINNGSLLRRIVGHTKRVTALAFTSDGQNVLTSSLDGTIAQFRVSDGAELTRYTGHSGGVLGMDLSPNDRYIVSSGQDSTIRIWDRESSDPLATYDVETGKGYGGLGPVAWARDSAQYAYGRGDGSVGMAIYGKRVSPVSFQVTKGALQSGSIVDLLQSDDSKLSISQRAPFSVSDPNAQLVVTGNVPGGQTALLAFTLESSVSASPAKNVVQRVELFDFLANKWVNIDERPSSAPDEQVLLVSPGDPERFVNQASREVKARISWFDRGTIGLSWSARVDLARWTFAVK